MSKKYVLDSSAIISLTINTEEIAIDIFKESLTSTLAFYEIGNFLWKNKLENLTDQFIKVLNFIEAENVGLNKEIVSLSIKENLTYYDATFLYLSKKYGLKLVSDDKDLVKKGAIPSTKIVEIYKDKSIW